MHVFSFLGLNIFLSKGKEDVEINSHLWLFPSLEDNIGLQLTPFATKCLVFCFDMLSRQKSSYQIVSWMCHLQKGTRVWF